jgi:hypothetical protein
MVDKINRGLPGGMKTAIYWVLGIGIIALILLVLLILFGNLSGNLGFGQESVSVTNNTIGLTNINFSQSVGRINPILTDVVVINASGGETITSSNYTISEGTIIAIAGTNYAGVIVNASATLSYDEFGKIYTEELITNYSESATNVSAQFPVTGTIVGVALLLVILIGVLIFAVKKMMGMTNGVSTGSTSGRRFMGRETGSIV